MSISAAVAALDKEIELLDKKRARLGSLRDALVVEGESAALAVPATAPVKGKPGPKPGAAKKGKPGPKPGSAKKAVTPAPTAAKRGKPGPKPGVVKKAATGVTAVSPKKAGAPVKRVMSAEAKKKIGEAAKARWAAKAATKKSV